MLSVLTLFNCTGLDTCPTQPQTIANTPQYENTVDPLESSYQLTPKTTVQLDVPFSSQSPDQQWIDPYDEACEETSIIMVEYYLRGQNLTKEAAIGLINSMVDWQKKRGFGVDIGISATAFHARNFFNRTTYAYYDAQVTEQNIKKILSNGYPVIIPASGKTLANPNFINGGPPYHMIVLTGYDSDGFFANDPGTQFGKNYKYSFATVMESIHDWTGSKDTVEQGGRAMLVINP